MVEAEGNVNLKPAYCPWCQ